MLATPCRQPADGREPATAPSRGARGASMFVALRDLRFARGRFALMGAVVGMVSLLMVLLTGLSTGLVDDNVSAIADLPADHLSFSAESGVRFNQSTVTEDQWTRVASAP